MARGATVRDGGDIRDRGRATTTARRSSSRPGSPPTLSPARWSSARRWSMPQGRRGRVPGRRAGRTQGCRRCDAPVRRHPGQR